MALVVERAPRKVHENNTSRKNRNNVPNHHEILKYLSIVVQIIQKTLKLSAILALEIIFTFFQIVEKGFNNNPIV